MKAHTRLFPAALFLIALAFWGCSVADEETGFGILSTANQALIDADTESEVVGGNAIELLIDGAASYPARNEIIAAAREHINLQTLLFENNATGHETADLLVEKAAEGVEVNVIVDWISQQFDSNMRMIWAMERGGVNVIFYGPVAWGRDYNERVHEKLLIVDGESAIMGGLNIGDNYFLGGVDPDGWRDTDILVRGPIVADLQQAFLKNWDEYNKTEDPGFSDDYARFYPPLAREGNMSARFVHHTPRLQDFSIYFLYLDVIDMAVDHIYIESPYFIPTPELRIALMNAADRGVDVQVITNSEESNDLGGPLYFASLYYFEDFIQHGIKVYLWQGPTIHSKVATIDGNWSTVGSFNLEFRSCFSNSESNMTIHGGAFAAEMEEMFFDDMERGAVIEVDEDFMEALSARDRRRMELFHIFEYFL